MLLHELDYGFHDLDISEFNRFSINDFNMRRNSSKINVEQFNYGACQQFYFDRVKKKTWNGISIH